MKFLGPKEVGVRILYAFALLWAVSFIAHQIVLWLTPVIPLVIVVAVLMMIWAVVFGRRRK
ncbi:MAG TPA: hypothetical protein VGX23_23665 [Actinocrinis sp.]|nr:hypothetical protein [Actinocrinis sp.]